MISIQRRFAGVLLFSSLVLLPGCKGMDETEKLSQDYFELLKAGEYQEAYDGGSEEFKYSVSYEDFVDYVETNRFNEYVDFTATSYGFEKDTSYSTRTVTGDIRFSDGEIPTIKVDWIEQEDTWKFLGMEFYPVEEEESGL